MNILSSYGQYILTCHSLPKSISCQRSYQVHPSQYKRQLDLTNQPGYLVLEVNHCLLCPMQSMINVVWCRDNETPKFLTHNPTSSSHSILIADTMDSAHPYNTPLQLESVVKYFVYALPTSFDYEDDEISHLDLWPWFHPGTLTMMTLLFKKRVTLISGDTLSLLQE